jgi:uncharacterized lipoprotein
MDRAWNAVMLGIDRMGHIVLERDKKNGMINVRVGEGATGFLSGFEEMFSSRDTFTLHLIEDGGKVRIVVMTDDGKTDTSVAAQNILTQLHEKL